MTTLRYAAVALFALIGSGTPPAAAAQEKIRMATIAPGSSAYLVMTTMASTVNAAQNDYRVSVDATGAATKHMIEAAEGKLDIVMSSPTVMSFMQNGKAMYAKLAKAPELAKNLRLIYWFPYGAYHVVTYADSGIERLQDLRGKKVFLGPPGGGAFNTAKQWLQVTTGMQPGADFDSVKASWGAALQGFQDRQFDAYFIGGIAPFPQIEQLALTADLRLLGLSRDEADAALTDPAFKKTVAGLGRTLEVIEPQVYGDGVVNSEPVYTVGATVGVVARADLADDAVYAITKTFWDRIDEVRAAAPYMNQVTLDGAFGATLLRLHPGALRYYREAGVAVPDEIQ